MSDNKTQPTQPLATQNDTASGESPSSDTAPTVQCVETLVKSFYEHVGQLLDAMIEVWPECKELRKKKLELDLACTHAPQSMCDTNRKQLIVGYHDIMHHKYDLCMKRDDCIMTDRAFHEKVPLLQGIDFDQKWADDDIDDETKTNMWEYILNLNRFANMHNLYSKVPSNMMKNIESMAETIHTNIERGDGDMNIEAISGQVMQNLNKDDIKSFAKHLSQNVGDITSVCSMLGDMLKPVANGNN